MNKGKRQWLVTGLICVIGMGLPGSLWGQWSNGTGGAIFYSGGNVGIGTGTPGQKFEISTTGALYVKESGTGDTAWWSTDGSYSVFSGLLGGSGCGIGNWTVYAAGCRMVVTQAGNVGIGTVNPQSLLSVNGTITTKQVTVTTTGWSDYVFRRDYHLSPLSEVASYIQANGHLPEIPSESEVKEKGVDIGDMQAKLLAKIEELTLHMIQAEERNQRMESENQELRARVKRLEERAPEVK